MNILAGKNALVTGAGRGIGRAIAERLGRDGARVGVHYGHDEHGAAQTLEAIRSAGGDGFVIAAELGKPGDAEALWSAFAEHTTDLDILVNNAGVGDLRAPIEATTEESFDRLFAVNTKAPFFVTKLGIPLIRDGGRIVNVSASLTHGLAMPELVAYAMTKSAIDALTTALAKQLGARGITVNAVGPGVVDTDMNAAWLRSSDEARAGVSSLSPLARVAQPEDVASIVAFLASEDSRWVTGQWIDATGGALL